MTYSIDQESPVTPPHHQHAFGTDPIDVQFSSPNSFRPLGFLNARYGASVESDRLLPTSLEHQEYNQYYEKEGLDDQVVDYSVNGGPVGEDSPMNEHTVVIKKQLPSKTGTFSVFLNITKTFAGAGK